MDNTKLVIAISAGAVVATTVWWLFSTDKGEEIRDRMIETSEKLLDKVLDKGADFVEDMVDNLLSGNKITTTAFREVKDAAY